MRVDVNRLIVDVAETFPRHDIRVRLGSVAADSFSFADILDTASLAISMMCDGSWYSRGEGV